MGIFSRSLPHSIQQRNGRKTLTTVQGIDEKFDLKKLVRVFKKGMYRDPRIHYHPNHMYIEFATNGNVVEDTEKFGSIIQLQVCVVFMLFKSKI